MKTYVVGGAVRDRLLGLPVADRDHVVVGATPAQMIAAGFRPVGQDFPVFLHPTTHEEYALARTERKVAPGYAGFTFHSDPGVTLEEDLGRRDLTINAMAQADDGKIIDPFNGRRDLEDRIFRHVSEAFVEDPVRILRLARFAARFEQFTVAPETHALMRQMVAVGEVDALVAERVWQEISRGLMQSRPSRMIEVLIGCGALPRIAPGLGNAPDGASSLAALDQAARDGASLEARFAIWMLAWPWPSQGLTGLTTLCQHWRVPGDCRDLATLALREAPVIAEAAAASPAGLLELLGRTDAFRKAPRFEELLMVCSRAGSPPADDAAIQRVRAALSGARSVDAGQVARSVSAGTSGDGIREAVAKARVQAIAAALTTPAPRA